LFFGRNEESGLRCVYHGWKFDVTGACVDMPNEPAESDFKHKVAATAYECRERGGVIWAYMGPTRAPDLPDMEWNQVPENQVLLTKRVATNNWLQALEGDIDSSHAPILHGRLNPGSTGPLGSRIEMFHRASADLGPRLETLATEYGVAIAARRDGRKPGTYYWRLNQFLLPFWTMVPTGAVLHGHAWVPIDDNSVLVFNYGYHPSKPLDDGVLRPALGNGGREGGHPSPDVFLPATSQPHGAWFPKYNWSNDFGLDRELEKEWFAGLPGVWPQDSGCQESMGTVVDRTREHLGAADSGIIQMRRTLLSAAERLQASGEKPASATNPSLFRVRPVSVELPHDVSWLEGAQKLALTDGEYQYVPA
jgi:hypothetical protein